MSKRKPSSRRASSKPKGGSVWSWLILFGVAIGGIQVYEHRDTLLPKMRGIVASASKPSAPAMREASAPKQVAALKPSQTVGLPTTGAPIPPRSIASAGSALSTGQLPPATLPSQRPQVENVSLGAKPGTFAFCGRSGLNNCVMDGKHLLDEGRKDEACWHRGAANGSGPLHGRTCPRLHRQGASARHAELRQLPGCSRRQGAEVKALSRSGVSFAIS